LPRTYLSDKGRRYRQRSVGYRQQKRRKAPGAGP